MNALMNQWRKLRDAYANRYQPEGVRVLAYFYWYTLLLLIVFVVLVVSLYGYWQFKTILNSSTQGSQTIPDGATKPPVTEEELEGVLQTFEDRRSTYEALKQAPPKVSDPSR
ncbi:hypothetical protein C4585_03025 [Candidatus Parcubacteria bacterium]|nr:MAG: hypothetical protein C4585_03025 [Candidatus Parcubacteria bacterium]